MSLAILHTRTLFGLRAAAVRVEVHLSGGLPSFSIVGLAETSVKESKDRVRSAIINSAFYFPVGRITVNLAPADLPKEGNHFDLPIALGILIASRQIAANETDLYEFAGELALSGELRPVRGILPFAIATQKEQRALMIAPENVQEAQLIADLSILPATHLLKIAAHFNKEEQLSTITKKISLQEIQYTADLREVRGQPHARRALEISAAGGHNLLMIGPPGTGKTMLASRLPSILPPLSEAACLAIAMVASVSQQGFQYQQWGQRPFRAPHHTASGVALVGGGNPPKPGEISMAHLGILFLDELPEFQRQVIDALRQPLESGSITISRANHQVEFPANFQLVAAMNPCPCGYAGSSQQPCRCGAERVQRYLQKISGPLLDRIDIQIDVPPPPLSLLSTLESTEEDSSTVRARVEACTLRQWQRNGGELKNYQLQGRQLMAVCDLHPEHNLFLQQAVEKLGLSARAYYRILRVARTIADLAEEASVSQHHIAEALSYRRIERLLAAMKHQ